jgi:hypothetical protein
MSFEAGRRAQVAAQDARNGWQEIGELGEQTTKRPVTLFGLPASDLHLRGSGGSVLVQDIGDSCLKT